MTERPDKARYELASTHADAIIEASRNLSLAIDEAARDGYLTLLVLEGFKSLYENRFLSDGCSGVKATVYFELGVSRGL